MEGSHCMTFHLLKRVYSQHKTARSRIKNTENEQLLGYCTHPLIPSTFLHNSGMVKNQSTGSITSKFKKKPKCKIWNTFPRITKNRKYFNSFPNFYSIIVIPDNAPFSLFFHVFFLLSFSSSFFPLLLVFLSFTHLYSTHNLILHLLEHYIMQSYMKFGANLLRRNRPSNNVLKRKMDPVLYANRFKVPEVQPLKYKKGDELPFAVYWLYACLG